MKKKLALLLTVLLLVSVFAACGQSAETSAVEDGFAYSSNQAADLEYMMEEPAMPEAEEEKAAFSTSTQTSNTAMLPEEQIENFNEKIIYTGYIHMQTTEFDDTVLQLENIVKEFGGFVQDSSVQGNARTMSDGSTVVQDRWAHYVVRIPTDKFNTFMSRADGIGNVTNSSRSAQNVTSQYTDYEARLSSLKIQEERLLEMLKQSGDLDSLITLEARLSEVRYEIESIERNLRNLDQKLAYSTVDLEVQEVEKYTPYVPVTRTFGEKLKDAFSDGWNGFMRSLKNFILWLAESLLTLIFLAVIIFIGVKIIKKRRTNRKEKKQTKKEPENTVTPPPAE